MGVCVYVDMGVSVCVYVYGFKLVYGFWKPMSSGSSGRCPAAAAAGGAKQLRGAEDGCLLLELCASV